VQVNGISGHREPSPATRWECLLSSRSRVRIALGALIRAILRITAPPDTASVQVGPDTYQATLSGLSQSATDTFTVTATNAIGPGMAGTASSATCAPIASLSVSDSAAAQAEADWTDAQTANAPAYTSASLDTAIQAGQIQPAVGPAPATGECQSLTTTLNSATSADAITPLDPAASHSITGYPTVGDRGARHQCAEQGRGRGG